MGVGKAVETIVEGTRAARRGAKVDQAVSAARRGAANRGQQAQLSLQEIVADHNASIKSQGAQSELVAVRKGLTEEQEQFRVSELEDRTFSPSADVDLSAQARDPESFRRKYHQQLSDPDFSTRGGQLMHMDSPPLPKEMIVESQINDFVFQGLAGGQALRGRSGIRAMNWLGDSPYTRSFSSDKPRIFVHIDRHTDPTRPNDLIQFDDPWEMGVHSGTNEAAILATIGQGHTAQDALQGTMARLKQFDADLDELFGYSEFPKEDREVFVTALENHFRQRFTRGGSDVETWEEAKEIIEGTLYDIGAPTELVNQYIAKAKNFPNANSTPHLFRGKNGLYLRDLGGFQAENVAKQLEQIFPDNLNEIKAAMSQSGGKNRQLALRKFIEDQGYDHIIYHNALEDRGSLSIINWNRDLYMPLYSEEILGNSKNIVEAKVAGALAMLGIGAGAVQIPTEADGGA